MSSEKPIYTVAVSLVTGTQGLEIVRRVEELNKSGGAFLFHVRGLCRNSKSSKHDVVNLRNMDYVTLVDVDYFSPESLDQALKGADAMYINFAMMENRTVADKNMVDAALRQNLKHIIFASTGSCDKPHGVPHWECCNEVEQYMKEKCKGKILYHFLRLAHFNENLTTFFKPKNGKMFYPWDPSIEVATHSIRDVARAACKLFANPKLLENGSYIDCGTEYATPDQFAENVSKALGEKVIAKKGPWIFVTFGTWFGWEPATIVKMGRFIDSGGFTRDFSRIDQMPAFLKEEIQEEPLEMNERFCMRVFAGNKEVSKEDKEAGVGLVATVAGIALAGAIAVVLVYKRAV